MNYGRKQDFQDLPIDLSREEDFAVGGLQVSPSTREVRTPQGSETVEPRVMQAMVRLFRASGAVVSRDDLIRSCWSGRAVGEDAINRCISKLRLLGGNTEPSSFVIETVPRVGYRLRAAEQSRLETAARAGQSRISICVLPFANLSNDLEQECLADGITADIVTDLSRWPSLAVLSRHATLRFKGQAIDPRAVARDLNVRFVVEGSLRRMGERLRITAQLVEAETGSQIWAERFDRQVEDFFVLQDEVVQSIVGTLVGRVYTSEGARLRRRHPPSLAAYELTMRANALPWDEPVGAAEAKCAFEKAIELDPDFALPYSYLAVMLKRDWEDDITASDDVLDRALALAQRGVELADNESTSHAVLGSVHMFRRSHDQALYQYERAIKINPANHWNQADFGELLSYIGRAEEGLEKIRGARRADPYLGMPWYWRTLGLAHFVLQHYTDALDAFEHAPAYGTPSALAMMAACCAKMGRMERADALLARCFSGVPEQRISLVVRKFPFKNDNDVEHLIECLRLAGGWRVI